MANTNFCCVYQQLALCWLCSVVAGLPVCHRVFPIRFGQIDSVRDRSAIRFVHHIQVSASLLVLLKAHHCIPQFNSACLLHIFDLTAFCSVVMSGSIATISWWLNGLHSTQDCNWSSRLVVLNAHCSVLTCDQQSLLILCNFSKVQHFECHWSKTMMNWIEKSIRLCKSIEIFFTKLECSVIHVCVYFLISN